MVQIPVSIAGWFHFSQLDSLYGVGGVYTLAWRLIDVPTDPWTKRLMEFKFAGNGTKPVRAASAALEQALPSLFHHTRWDPAETGILPALSSSDTKTVQSKPLPTVVKHCADQLGLRSVATLLAKNAHRPLRSLSGAAERRMEVLKANYQTTFPLPGRLKRVLVVDDL
jgi:hypothetical protein